MKERRFVDRFQIGVELTPEEIIERVAPILKNYTCSMKCELIGGRKGSRDVDKERLEEIIRELKGDRSLIYFELQLKRDGGSPVDRGGEEYLPFMAIKFKREPGEVYRVTYAHRRLKGEVPPEEVSPKRRRERAFYYGML